jgi:putative SOS response-associated peptidase YedK
MCTRYSLHSDAQVISRHFGLDALPAFAPRSDIAPGASTLIVRPQGAALAHWGMKGGVHNARAETLAVKLSLREAYHRRRCLIPANGFYEWKGDGASRQAYYIRPAELELFAFAGLWERSQGVETFSVITVEANFAVRAIRDRMPVIISPEHYAGWLHGEEGLVRPAPHNAVRCEPVGAELDSEIQRTVLN